MSDELILKSNIIALLFRTNG